MNELNGISLIRWHQLLESDWIYQDSELVT